MRTPRDLESILLLKESPPRTAALAGWVQDMFVAAGAIAPVLVGGAAVELFTKGAYTTGDLDFVGEVPSTVRNALLRAGFRKEGRHYIREKGRIFLEFPSPVLEEGEIAVTVRTGGRSLRILSPEDLIVNRLAAWKHWRSVVDGVNAYFLYRARRRTLERKRLSLRAGAAGVGDSLKTLRAQTGSE